MDGDMESPPYPNVKYISEKIVKIENLFKKSIFISLSILKTADYRSIKYST
ncbi:hypothetical protein CYANOKiyG1_56710 [Okeania sp. KiyG1]|nr:hypothetical protein CYANOKiyG1_56710 [Okeania sp. KiyG1]